MNFSKISAKFRKFQFLLGHFFQFFVKPEYSSGRFKKLFNAFEHMVQFLQHQEYTNPGDVSLEKLRISVENQHKLLPTDARYSYSILIPVYKPKPEYFRKAVESALQQTAPNFEVLLGYDGPQPNGVYQVAEELNKKYPNKIRTFQIDREKSGGGISATTNYIANEAKGNFLLLMDHDDWIRPDLLYRYELKLRVLPEGEDKEGVVLYCDEYKIDEKDRPIYESGIKKPDQPIFPYFFINFICHCLLVPRNLWVKVGGERSECNGGQDYDLVMRLDLAGAKFHNIPFFLYAWRSHKESTAKNSQQKSYAFEGALRALKDYQEAKKLNWKVEHGLLLTSYRAIPKLEAVPSIHVIILNVQNNAQNSGGLLKTLKSVLLQQGVKTQITICNNFGVDLKAFQELRDHNVEILTSDAFFNPSKLHDFAVQNSKTGNKCDLLLFLSSEIELEAGALEEMARWIYQPEIGIVGCRLNYPNGLLQHGGIEKSKFGAAYNRGWYYCEQGRPYDSLGWSRILRIVDAVTPDCVLLKKEDFLSVGGFDQICNLQGTEDVSGDVSLALKLKDIGLHCLYTPYAVGVHHG